MKKFDYRAKTVGGKKVTGIAEAVSEKEVIRILRDRQLIVFSLKEKKKHSLASSLTFLQRVSSKDVTSFTRQLSTMISSGLSLTDSLIMLRDQSRPGLAKILTEVVKDIEGGSSLYSALSKHPEAFSKIYLAIIRSGEASGALDKVLNRMADSLEKNQEFRTKVKGAMIYPILIVTGMIIVIFIMMVYVIPKLTSMYQEFGTELPMPTKILMAVSTFMSKFWLIIIGGVAFTIYSLQKWRRTTFGREKVDALLLKIPIIGNLLTKIILTEISRTLSMLLSAGVTIIGSLNIVAEAANNVIFESSIKKASKEVERGISLAAALQKYEEYPPLLIQMIAIGEETGKLDDSLLRISKQFEMESESAIKNLTTAIEPLMMVVLGVGVGFIVISVITPIYNLTSQF